MSRFRKRRFSKAAKARLTEQPAAPGRAPLPPTSACADERCGGTRPNSLRIIRWNPTRACTHTHTLTNTHTHTTHSRTHTHTFKHPLCAGFLELDTWSLGLDRRGHRGLRGRREGLRELLLRMAAVCLTTKTCLKKN